MSEGSPPDGGHPVRWSRLATAVAAAAAAVLVVTLGWPLGVPGEWTWAVRPGVSVPAVLLALWGLGWCLLADRTAGRYADAVRENRRTGWWVAGLLIASFAWVSVTLRIVDLTDTAAGATREPWVLFFSGTSGYFEAARTDPRPTLDWLREYRAEVERGDYLHQGTHPPGLILLYRGLITVVETVPGMRATAETLMSPGWRDSVQTVLTFAGRPTHVSTPAVLWWAAVLTQWSVAAVTPLLLLLGGGDASDRWRVATLWPLIPAAVVFLPKSDCLLPPLGLFVALLWRDGCRGDVEKAAVAGLVAGVSLSISLALAPVFAGLGIGSIVWARRTGGWRALGSGTLAAGAGFAVPGVLPIIAGVHIPHIWVGNLANHAAFYEHFPRTYLAWLPVNLLEGAMAASLPVIAGLLMAGRRGDRSPPESPVAAMTIGVLVAWGLLWISGKNMGEAARLWVMLTPYPLLLLSYRSCGRPLWGAVAVGTAVATAAVITRIDGFNLASAGG